MSELLDEAREFLKDRELYPGDAKHYADFAAAAVGHERERILAELTDGRLCRLSDHMQGLCECLEVREYFAAELKESECKR